jgi:hypothetical protein
LLKKILLLIFFILFNTIYTQEYAVNGTIVDSDSKKPLSYANILIENTSRGTSANIEGRFQIRLPEDSYTLITSYIGYKSDTLSVNLNEDKNVLIELKSVAINLPEVTVLPGENPALEVIRRAIKSKEERNKKLDNYIFSVYTKGLIETTEDFTSTSNEASIDVSFEPDTADLRITGILENESKGYFKKPDKYKEEIVARKQSANMPAEVNLLTGGRIIQDFYKDDIRFFGREFLGPISNEGLDFYYYIIEDTLAIDNKNVFKINITAVNADLPGFVGDIYIEDQTFNLLKLEIGLNDAAMPGGIFSKILIIQQFVPFEKDIYMPIDYRLFIEGNVFGIAKFGFEINSIMYNYDINTVELTDDFFDMAIITVAPDADKKDSLYWENIQTIPNTDDERTAYLRIDSLESIEKTFWENFSFTSERIRLDENLYTTGPLGFYSFNRVEGHTINLDFFYENAFDKRFDAYINLSQGIDDKRFKFDTKSSYMIGDYRTTKISFGAYKKLSDLFSESIQYNKFTSTFANIFLKDDFRDYYYADGYEFDIESEVTPVLKLNAGFINRNDKSARVNSDWSIFATGEKIDENPAIYPIKVNAVKTGFTLDFRKYIEDGYYRRRINDGNYLPIISIEFIYSDKNNLKSNVDCKAYKGNISGDFRTFKTASFVYEIEGFYSNGPVPFQWLHALPGNVSGGAKSFTFRTLEVGEIYGDRSLRLSCEKRFRDELFKALNLPFFADYDLTFDINFAMALNNVSEKSRKISPHEFKVFKSPFYEVGFSLGHILIPIKLNFSWKLNYLNDNNFAIGFDADIL